MRKLSFLLMMFSMISISLMSCGDDDEGGGGDIYTGSNCYSAWGNAYSQGIQEIASASQAYSLNPTPENCNAFKTAYEDFLENVKPFQNCAAIGGQERQEFIDQIEEAEAEVDDLC